VTYTQLGVLACLLVIAFDLWAAQTKLVTRRLFWVSYAIIVFFQLITNGMFTGFGIVRYSGDAIIGGSSPVAGPPPFIGDGRLAFAPVEDLLFGFALVLLSLTCWIWLGRRGLQSTPNCGPPICRRAPTEPDEGP